MPVSALAIARSICVLLLTGCVANAQNDLPTLPPAEAAAAVVVQIEAAAQPDAEEAAWNTAHELFANTLERRLVTHYGAARILPVEYGFSRLHGRLGDAEAAAIATELGAEIAGLAASLPTPPHPQ